MTYAKPTFSEPQPPPTFPPSFELSLAQLHPDLEMSSRLLFRSFRPLVRPPTPLLRRTFLDHPPPRPPKPPLSRPPPKHRPPYTVQDAEYRSELAAEKRRTWNLTAGAVVCMILMWIFARTQEIKSESDGDIDPGLPVVVGELGEEEKEKEKSVELVETGAGVPPFPKTLKLPEDENKEEEYVLVGLGVRTVSFLSIQVYVVGFYIHVDDLAAVQERLLCRLQRSATPATPAEREELKKVLLDKDEGEKFFADTLGSGGWRSVLRIVPTRNTDYQHLRDGWVRGIQARSTKSAAYDDENFVNALTDFKALFGGHKKSVPKQKVLLLARDKNGKLSCLYDGSGRNDGKLGGKRKKEQLVKLGEVVDGRLSQVLWLCYLAGEKVASEGARESIVEGLMELLDRSVEITGVAKV